MFPQMVITLMALVADALENLVVTALSLLEEF